MKLADLIVRLDELRGTYGSDMEVFMDVGPNGLIEIGEVDVDAEDSGIIIWPVEE